LHNEAFFSKDMMTDKLYEIFRESSGISTDSRTVKKGQIFFALWGENYNGNKFAAEALETGAGWAVIDDPAYETDKTILVDDCLFELQALALHHRKELNASVIAITGTNGKTTTKELLAAILSKKYKVHSTKGNLNNNIGVPLTILSAPEETQMMVIEMGANHIGEIKTLSHIAKPDYGIITNIGHAHIEGFGSFDGVVRSKTELYEYLRKVNGVALYNDKDRLLAEKIFKLVNRAVPFSDPTGIDLIIEQEESDMYLALTVTYSGQKFQINTKLFGSYNIENVRAAIATSLFLEVEMDDIVDAVQNYDPGNNRSQVKVTKKNTLICDSYNANPASMQLAIESFIAVKAEKKICILGDMLELGETANEEHLKIVNFLKSNNLKDSLLTGPYFCKAAKGSGLSSFPDTDKLIEFLKTKHVSGHHILIKGSRGIAMEKVYDLL
jgi:UDP-N-acetylmuramoyl-tripeptide--D-alanyl-D-alanine ligase